MPEHDIQALERLQLLPRLLHRVEETDSSLDILGHPCPAPIVPLIEQGNANPQRLSLVEAARVLESEEPTALSVPLIPCLRMGELMPLVRKLVARNVPALALDMTTLSETPPYGQHLFRPKGREELAELGAAVGRPLWLYGVASPADAEIAVEAGCEAIVVHSGVGFYLGSPATAEIFPDIFDTVAGMVSVYAGGPIQSGIDVFRYLALGAELVIADSDRAYDNLVEELHYAMKLTACATLADISYEAIFAPLF